MSLHPLPGGFSQPSGKDASSKEEQLEKTTNSKIHKHTKQRKSKNIHSTKVGNSKGTLHNVHISSANCAGCQNKTQSLLDNVNHLGVGIFTLQETHFKRKGKLNAKFCDFEIFEAIRKKQKGGTLIGAHKSLNPILIEEYSEDFELLVIEVTIGGKDIRNISGYGPQENWPKEQRTPFFEALEQEVIKAKSNNKLVLVQMDANSKLGPKIIKGDPHTQSDNGKILAEIIVRNEMCVINSSQKCKGKKPDRQLPKTRKKKVLLIL